MTFYETINFDFYFSFLNSNVFQECDASDPQSYRCLSRVEGYEPSAFHVYPPTQKTTGFARGAPLDLSQEIFPIFSFASIGILRYLP